MLELLVHAGLLVPKGMVLNREAHREFLDQSGLLEGGEDSALRTLRICPSHRSTWLSLGGLKHQLEAMSHGEVIPIWPVLRDYFDFWEHELLPIFFEKLEQRQMTKGVP